MRRTEAARKAQNIAARLMENHATRHEDWDGFQRRQRALWDEAQRNRTVDVMVCAILRGDDPMQEPPMPRGLVVVHA